MATANASTGTGSANQEAGKVFIVYGKAKAISSDGTERALGPNSPIFEYDRIITESDGKLSIILNDPAQTQIDIGRMSDIYIDEDVFAGATQEEIAEVAAEVEEIQEAIMAEDFDPTIELEAAAAGGAASGGGGHPVPEFARVTQDGEITSGAETIGITSDTINPLPAAVEDTSIPSIDAGSGGEVWEAGLPDGSAPGAFNTTTSGDLAITHSNPDIDSTALIEIQDASGVWIPVTADNTLVVGEYGNLYVDMDGTWQYELTDNTLDHPDNVFDDGDADRGADDSVLDNFATRVTDTSGDMTDADGIDTTEILTIAVNDDGPAAIDDETSGAEDEIVTYNVITNTDGTSDIPGADDADLTGAVLAPDYEGTGEITFNANGEITFAPISGFDGPKVEIDYTLTDGDGDLANATLTILYPGDSVPTIVADTDLIIDVNDAEVWESALPDGSGGGTTTDSGHFVIDTGNDTLKLLEVQDVNGDWVAINTDNTTVQGEYGKLNVDMDGSWEYEIFENTLDHPDTIFTDGDGDRDRADQVFDHFATRVTDSDDDSTFTDGVQSSEVLTIAVNDDGPEAVDDYAGTYAQDTTVSYNVMGNDEPGADDVTELTGATLANPSAGVITGFTSNGNITFNPNPNFSGTVQIDYTITDADDDNSSASLFINYEVPPPPPPENILADGNESVTTEESIPVSGDLLNNTTNPDGPAAATVTQFIVNGDVYTAGQTATFDGGEGKLTIGTNGAFTFTPEPGYSGPVPDTDYTVFDGEDTDPSTLSISIIADAVPTAGRSEATVDDDGLLSPNGNPASTTFDIDANVNDDPADTSEKSFTGTLDFNFGGDGAGSIDFDAMDTLTDSVGQETVTYGWNGGSNTLTATITGGDRNGDELFNVVVNPTTGAYTVTLVDNVIHAQGPNDENSTDPDVDLTFNVTDSDGSPTTGTLNITFDDDAPTAVDHTPTVEPAEDVPGGILIDVNADIADGADGVNLETGVAVTTGPNKGTLDYNDDGTFTYTQTPGQTGPDSFVYTVTDGDGDTDTAKVSLSLIDTGPTVDPDPGEVNESALPEGTDPDPGGAGTLIYTGNLNVNPANDSIAEVRIGGSGGVLVPNNGSTAALAGTQGSTIGTLVVSGDGAGNYTYTYTLKDNTEDHDQQDSTPDDVIDSFNVWVKDADGSTASDTLDITITDDDILVTQVSDGHIANQVYSLTLNGTFNVVGADDDVYTADLSSNTAPADLYSNGKAVSYYVDSGNPDTLLAVTDLSNPTGSKVFTLDVDPNSDGYTLTTHARLDSVTTFDVDAASSSWPSGPISSMYITENGGYATIAAAGGEPIKIIATTTDTSSDLVNGSTNGLGIDGQWIGDDAATSGVDNGTPETMVLDFINPVTAVDIGIWAHSNGTAGVTWTAYSTGPEGPVSGTALVGHLSSFTISNLGFTIDKIELGYDDTNDYYRIQTLSVSEISADEDINLSFGVSLLDSDQNNSATEADTTDATINIEFDGDHTMTGTAGVNDVFVLGSAAETIDAAQGLGDADVIDNYNSSMDSLLDDADDVQI